MRIKVANVSTILWWEVDILQVVSIAEGAFCI